jgi:O-antigen/teichoic acid export membrane protein
MSLPCFSPWKAYNRLRSFYFCKAISMGMMIPQAIIPPMDVSLSLERIKVWGMKGGMSILDQGIFSASNFILGILLARWLSSEQFGAYTIGLTVLVFVYQFYIAFLLDPMGVLGPAQFPENLREYFVIHLRSHFAITIIVGVVFIVISFAGIENQLLLKQTLFVIGLTLPILLLPWYLRRVFYVLGRPVVAMWGSVVYTLSLTVLTILFHQLNLLSSPAAIFITAIASLLSGLYLLLIFQIRSLYPSIASFTAVITENWNFGKWLITSSIFIAFASQAQIWISAKLLGLSAAGMLRALQIIVQPMMLTITALTAVATPTLSLAFSKGDFESFNRRVVFLSLALLTLAIIFEAFLLIFSIPIEKLIYGGKFSTHAFLLPIWGTIPLCLAYSSGIQAGLQAAQKPRAFLIAAILWTPASLGFGIWLTSRSGIAGATWSTLLGYIVFILILSFLYWYWVYRPYISPTTNYHN